MLLRKLKLNETTTTSLANSCSILSFGLLQSSTERKLHFNVLFKRKIHYYLTQNFRFLQADTHSSFIGKEVSGIVEI